MNPSQLAPQALFFGPDSNRLFGFLHPVATTASPTLGVLVCNPFGYESLHAHRSLRAFAVAAAAAGMPAMRFDYTGCGNSNGDEYTPDLIQAWVQSVHLAVDELKRRTGVSQVCLLGLRLGALLATLAAQERQDIACLVAIAPVVQGRQYIREMRAMSAGGDNPVKGRNGEALVEAGGFFFTDSSAQALSAIDLRTLDKAPARRILLVQRDDMPATPRWTDMLRTLGAEVHDQAWPGYAAMMEDPQKTQVPEQMLANTMLQLQAWAKELPVQAPGTIQPLAEPDGQYQTAVFRETLVRLEVHGNPLFGILTMPANGQIGASVLLLNQGCVHHIGPSRLWVSQARTWVRQGMAVLRVDLSGIGESEPHPGQPANYSYPAAAMDEIAVALEYLRQASGGAGCHLVGVCSGAYHAFQSAVTGKALLSAVVINPWIYSVAEAQVQGASDAVAIKDFELDAVSQGFKKKLLSWDRWKKLLSGGVDYRYLGTFVLKRGRQVLLSLWQKLGALVGIRPSTLLSRELGAAVRQGTRLRLVFSEGDQGIAVLLQNAQHTLDSLQSQQKLSMDLIAEADHTFTTFLAREKLLSIVNRHIGV